MMRLGDVRLVALTLMILCMAGCKAHKSVADHIVAQTETVAVGGEASEQATEATEWMAQAFAADSVEITINADSVAMPDGTIIYNPRIGLGAKNPAISIVSTSQRSEAEKYAKSDSLAVSSEIVEDKSEDKAAVSVAEPPSKTEWRWAIVLAAMLFAMLMAIKAKK